MKDGTRGLLRRAGKVIAYGYLPYSLPCLAAGAIYYGFFVDKRLYERLYPKDGLLGAVLESPIALPGVAYRKLRERLIDRPARQKRDELYRRIGSVLVTALRSEEIPIQSSSFDVMGGICVETEELDERQRFRFGEAVARTIKRFPDVPVATICGGLSPKDVFDEAWAKRHGFTDWVTDVDFLCTACARKTGSCWTFRAGAAELQKLNDLIEKLERESPHPTATPCPCLCFNDPDNCQDDDEGEDDD